MITPETGGSDADLTANDVLMDMMSDSIGPDNPMTDTAVDVASVEVVARLDVARAVLTAPDDADMDTGAYDSRAMFALYLISRED